MSLSLARPSIRPLNPNFSSGPCSKRPGWSFDILSDAPLGRSHRAVVGKAKLEQAIDLTRDVLRVPADYRIGIVPASDTGAIEMVMWSLLGPLPVDMLAWESFGAGWVKDVTDQLRLKDVRLLEAEYGALPDLSTVNFDRDVVFTWNGTTSGVCVPDGKWIDDNRKGLTICDATSAAFAQPLDFARLDVVTFSWQKVLGGEAAHGMVILSPRAVERLESYRPDWPMPKIFRLTKNGKLIEGIFRGETINTPSMLCVEDYLDALKWARSIGGLDVLMDRASANLDVVSEWVAKSSWADFLAQVPETISNTSICLKFCDPVIGNLGAKEQKTFSEGMVKRLAFENVAYDIGSYRDAPPGLRIWSGATIETSDISALLPWLDWAFEQELEALKF